MDSLSYLTITTTISESLLPEIPELPNRGDPKGFRRIEYGLVYIFLDCSSIT
jgi:hypothetical protein